MTVETPQQKLLSYLSEVVSFLLACASSWLRVAAPPLSLGSGRVADFLPQPGHGAALRQRRSPDTLAQQLHNQGLIVSGASSTPKDWRRRSANNYPQVSNTGGALPEQVVHCLRRQKAHAGARRAARRLASYSGPSETGLFVPSAWVFIWAAPPASSKESAHNVPIRVPVAER